MTVRLTLLAAAGVGAGPGARFGEDAPLGERARERARSVAVPAAARYRTAPSARCRETATLLGLDARVDEALRDLDPGAWRGRTLDEVAAADPAGLAAWTTDPDAAPHGGESVTSLCARAADWLDALPPGRLLAVTPPAFVRAAVVHALGAPPTAFWRVDVEPLALTRLSGRAGRWNLRLG